MHVAVNVGSESVSIMKESAVISISQNEFSSEVNRDKASVASSNHNVKFNRWKAQK